MPVPALPNLLIIGAGKAGTSSLHAYLSAHPECAMSRTKELNFFLGPGKAGHWDRGVEYYASKFPRGPARIRGEASPSYTNFPTYTGVPTRAHSVVPDAKLIYLVRDPIDRILSHFRMERARGGRRDLDFDEKVMGNLRNPYVRQSMYWLQLSQWLDYYPLERVLILETEQLLRDRTSALRRVFRFLEIDDEFKDPSFGDLNWTGDEYDAKAFGANAPPKPKVGGEQRRRLHDHLFDDIEEFRRRTGMKFSNWSV